MWVGVDVGGCGCGCVWMWVCVNVGGGGHNDTEKCTIRKSRHVKGNHIIPL